MREQTPHHWRWRLRVAPVVTGLLGLLLTSAVAAQEVAVSVGDSSRGLVLTDGPGMTLYTWDRDDPTATTIATSASATWPRFMVSGAPMVASGLAGTVGASPRADGGMQATYDGRPLYYFANDKTPADTIGDGVGGIWHVIALATAAPAPAAPPAPVAASATVGTAEDAQGRDVLTDAKGKSLYVLAQDRDNDNKSTCYADNECTDYWPPVLVDGAPVAAAGLPGQLGSRPRADFTTQATYNGRPLYTYIVDRNPGDMFGDSVTDEWGCWFLVPAE